MVDQMYSSLYSLILSFLVISSLQFGSLSSGNRILTRGEGHTGNNNNNRYSSKYWSENASPSNGNRWRWYRSWGDTGDDFSEHRKHNFCFRHPEAPPCNWPHPPPPDCAPCSARRPPPFGLPPRPFPALPPPPPLPLAPPPPAPPSWPEEPPNEQPDEQPPSDPYEIGKPFGYLPEAARKSLLASCTSGRVNCRGASPAMSAKRDMIAQQEKTTLRLYSPSTSYGYSSGSSLVEKQLEMTDSLKKTLLKAAGLGDQVEPIADGTFEQDVLLTEEQSNNLMKELNNYMASANKRYKRAVLFLEQMPTKRWDTSQPIPVYFDENVADYEKQMVLQAHQMIQATTCIRFQASLVKPTGSHIYYAKIPSPSFCGLSYIGKVSPINPVYLSFMCQDPVGVALHETMHALGMNHEHLRTDRDDFIDVKWSNINPQFYDYFAIADSSKFTPYGIAYDFGSIMHYNAFIAAIDSSKPTMSPKQNRALNQPLMGQRKRLSDRDVQMLNTMYCRPNCEDKNVYCGVWALRNLCSTRAQTGWMTQNCRKSCRLC